MYDVFESCINLPLSENVTGSLCGFGTNSFGVMNGPSGAKVSCDFAISQHQTFHLDPPTGGV
jgi:hypothetical protein